MYFTIPPPRYKCSTFLPCLSGAIIFPANTPYPSMKGWFVPIGNGLAMHTTTWYGHLCALLPELGHLKVTPGTWRDIYTLGFAVRWSPFVVRYSPFVRFSRFVKERDISWRYSLSSVGSYHGCHHHACLLGTLSTSMSPEGNTIYIYHVSNAYSPNHLGNEGQ